MVFVSDCIQKRVLAWVICLSLLWPISYAILGSTQQQCLASVPHQHILLRSARSHALERHLLAEQNCHEQEFSSEVYHFSDVWLQRREVISVLRNAESAITSVFNLAEDLFALGNLPVLTVVLGLIWLLPGTSLRLASLLTPPPLPPPKAIYAF